LIKEFFVNMLLFRIARAKYKPVLSGKGAAAFGARWNSEGIEMIYTALNRSLAVVEVAVHLTWATVPADYTMLTIEVPNDIAIDEILPSQLPPDWNQLRHPKSCKEVGDRFVADGKFCLLRVPSVVVPGEYNLLINPTHPDFARVEVIRIEPFTFDQRLLRP
jgi:RES domain-containing protein